MLKNVIKNSYLKRCFVLLLLTFILASPVFADNKIEEYNTELEKIKKQEKENAQKLTGIEISTI